MLFFIRTLFETGLKTNDYMEFAVITGCLRISKESVFTGVNNFTVFSMFNRPYVDEFGFSETEIRKMIEYYDLGEEVLNNIKVWYNGYHFDHVDIYNPWSVLNALKFACQDKEDNRLTQKNYLMPFWSNTGSNDIVGYLLEHADDNTVGTIENLLGGGSVRKTIEQDITFGNLYDLKAGVWSFLYYTGYLTPESVQIIKGKVIADLKIPNEEVRLIFHKHIDEWTAKVIENSKLDALYQAIAEGNTEVLCQEISKILLQTISYYDYRESFYHGFLTGILSGLSGYVMKTNNESGYGRSDIILKHIEGHKAIVLKFKYTKEESQLNSMAKEALEQIERMKYDSDLIGGKFECIIKYGIAFYKKKCFIVKGSHLLA